MPFERINKTTGEKRPHLEVVIEKKSMINLVQAYSVAVKVRSLLSSMLYSCIEP